MELLEQILSNQNMNEAYLRVYKNKGASGVDGVTVDELKQYLKENKDELAPAHQNKKIPTTSCLTSGDPKRKWKDAQIGNTNSSG
ncbi:GBSi1, group II intron, maturase [Peribacillus asahii]|uniref:GBSi1, group II intron, maturase n=1 Tax=Peribacillus asahii TaxID=228899 RepID=A0A3Q9RL74_9BACI|nr:GBSi1, group II intron, maturase [Peribacillus asahii]